MVDFIEYSELYHHGIKGQRWGVRRFQNKDGSLTPEGKRRLGLSDKDAYAEFEKEKKKINNKANAIGIGSAMIGLGGGTMGGLTAGVAVGSVAGPAGAIATYFGVKYGTVLASAALGALMMGDPDKKIDAVRKSYGEDRIKKMEVQAKKKAKEMTKKMNKEANTSK